MKMPDSEKPEMGRSSPARHPALMRLARLLGRYEGRLAVAQPMVGLRPYNSHYSNGFTPRVEGRTDEEAGH